MAKILKRIRHYLFHCPSFWTWKPAFKCPDCGKTYRCYWDGHDCVCGTIDICDECNKKHDKCEESK